MSNYEWVTEVYTVDVLAHCGNCGESIVTSGARAICPGCGKRWDIAIQLIPTV